MKPEIRKICIWIEETMREAGQEINPVTRKAAAAAVIENPYAGAYSSDLSGLMSIGAELGGLLGSRCVEALGISPEEAESYGKSAMVGENGELEHAAAILTRSWGLPCERRCPKAQRWFPQRRRWDAWVKFWTYL